MKKACLVILCIIYGAIACAQQSYDRKIVKYSSKEGLSYGYITGIVQDDNGFIWLSTEDGLNRFDGINFKVFKHNAANPNSLPSNYIDFMYKDTEGAIWLSTRQGIYQFNTNTEKYIKFKPGASISVNDLTTITAVKDIVWFSTYTNGVFSYNKKTGAFQNFNLKHLAPAIPNSATFSFQDSRGLLWVGAETTMSVFTTADGQVKKNLNDKIPVNKVPAGRVNAIVEDEYSNIWFATN